jgi:ATP-dependent helicase HrpB
MPRLPIDIVIPQLKLTLSARNAAVLVAPPGAGKTTRVPLALMGESWVAGKKIIMLEPRRLAARAAANRMADVLSDEVGGTVGLRMRMDTRTSSRTRIEVVTEGVFTRMIVDDPLLEGVGAVLFDEFHERSLDADLGLALALDVQAALRDDLRIVVMSATLDGARVARALKDAPVIASEGRAFAVVTHYLPRNARTRLEDAAAAAIRHALDSERGSMLVFLPGQAEINRTAERLSTLPASVHVYPLHGGLDMAAQNRAIAPAPVGSRKVVLATSIAETSLTLEGVRIVIDGGLARVPVYDVNAGVTRLATVKVSQAAADQRRGRAGRTEPGVCFRLWEEAATMGFMPFAKPEILSSDLSNLMLDLAAWGVTDPGALRWLDTPPEAAINEARSLLRSLGALDDDGWLTDRGKRLRRLPLPPRLAAMIVDSTDDEKQLGASLAALVTERGLGGDDVDVRERLRVFTRDNSPRSRNARDLAVRWAGTSAHKHSDIESAGRILARAFPDRIAQARGAQGSFRLANGRGASVDATHPLAREPFIVVADMTGTAAAGRITMAAPLTRDELMEVAGQRLTSRIETAFDPASASLRARMSERIDALVLSSQPRAVDTTPETAVILSNGLVQHAFERLPWPEAAPAWRLRVQFLARAEPDIWPDVSDGALKANAGEWLAPWLTGKTALSQIGANVLGTALKALLPYDLSHRLDQLAPSHFHAPTGSHVPIDYAGDEPVMAIRVQELFGVSVHPVVGAHRIPLVVKLLSPARRPVQITRDIPGFWRGSYAGVRADLRGRYPRHPWPEDPIAALPTNRVKPRGIHNRK